MTWTSLDTSVVLLGALSAMACALVGNYLVLRRMSMMGDAISHAVLPGLAVAFLISGSRTNVPMFLGAVVVGVLTALATQWIHRFGKVDEGASMGVVFTALFAVGLILIRQVHLDDIDLDPSCVLFGDLNTAVLDTFRFGGLRIPRPAVVLGVVLLINAAFIVAFFKELRLAAFDPELATTLGFNASVLHYVLMTLVAVTAVASFEVIGNILVVAMLIVPPAAAHLLTDRLGSMILVSLVIAAASALLGHIGATILPPMIGLPGTSSAGAMAATTGLIFMLALLLSPRHGVVSKAWHRWRLSRRIAGEDMLATMYRDEERGEARTVLAADTFTRRAALRVLRRLGLITPRDGAHALTDAGRDEARRLLRAHRLWETYLVDQAAVRADHTHGTAEQLEHITDHALRRRLDADTPPVDTDPQGRRIPPEDEG